MLGRALLTAAAISYVICVLVLSGVQKQDLDVNMLKKLQHHNINIDDLSNEQLQRECATKVVQKPKGRNEGNESNTNEMDNQLVLNKNEKENVRENLFRTTEPSNLETVLKYFKDQFISTTGVTTEVAESTTTKEKESLSNDDIEKRAKTLIEISFDKTDTKNPEIQKKLNWNDIINKNKQFLTDDDNAYINKPKVDTMVNKMQPYIKSFIQEENNQVAKENVDPRGMTQSLMSFDKTDTKHPETQKKTNWKDVINKNKEFLTKDDNAYINKPEIDTVVNKMQPFVKSFIQEENYQVAKENVDPRGMTQSSMSFDKTDTKHPETQKKLNWNDIINENKQFLTDDNAYIINKPKIDTMVNKMQPYIKRFIQEENNQVAKENVDPRGMTHSLMLPQIQNANEATQYIKNINSDTVMQALNQYLRHNDINPDKDIMNTEKNILDEMRTPYMEYLPYIFDRPSTTTENIINGNRAALSISDSIYPPDDLPEYEYGRLKNFPENKFNPNIPRYKYNYFLGDDVPIQRQRNPEKYFYTTISTRAIHSEDREINFPKEIIRQIAESVKDIVLKDLKKEFVTTETIRTTSPSTTQISIARAVDHSDQTTKIVPGPIPPAQIKNSDKVQQQNQMAENMAKIVAILNEMKNENLPSIRTHENIAKSTKHLDRTGRLREKTFVLNNDHVFPAQFLDMKRPDLMPPGIMQGQQLNQNVVPLQQRTPAEIRMAPLLIQTNLDQVPPLSFPLIESSLMNINIVVTTQLPFKTPHFDYNKRNPTNKFMNPQRKSNIPAKTFSNKNVKHDDHMDYGTHCTKNKNDEVFLNKTEEIMARIKNMEIFISNLQNKNDSTQTDKDQHQVSSSNKTNYMLLRDKRNNDTVNYLNDFKQSEDMIKKRTDEIGIVSSKHTNISEIVDQRKTPTYEKLTARSTTLEKALFEENPNLKLRNTENIFVHEKKKNELDMRLNNIERNLTRLTQQIRVRPQIIGKQLLDNLRRNRGRFNRNEPQYQKPSFYMPRYAPYKQGARRESARLPPRQVHQRYKGLQAEEQNNDILTKLKNMELRLSRTKNGGYGPMYRADPQETTYRRIPTSTNGARKIYSNNAKQDLFFVEAKKNPQRTEDSKDEGSNPYQEVVILQTKSRKSHNDVAPKYNKARIPHDTENNTVPQKNIKGFHEKLETADESPDLKRQEQRFEDNIDPVVDIPEIQANYDDTNVKNLLNTQEKVNEMLEKILSAQAEQLEPDVAIEHV